MYYTTAAPERRRKVNKPGSLLRYMYQFLPQEPHPPQPLSQGEGSYIDMTYIKLKDAS